MNSESSEMPTLNNSLSGTEGIFHNSYPAVAINNHSPSLDMDESPPTTNVSTSPSFSSYADEVPSTSEASAPEKSPQNYNEMFPALGLGGAPRPVVVAPPVVPVSFNQKMQVKSSNITHVYRVEKHSRRPISISEYRKACINIMAKTKTSIDLSSTKDETLCFLITGKDAGVQQAIRLIGSEVQTSTSGVAVVPKKYHGIIIGPNGSRLQSFQEQYGVRIRMPARDVDSDQISVEGAGSSVKKVIEEIENIGNDAASRDGIKLHIPKEFHPFISGPFGDTAKKIMEETGAKINIPSIAMNKNDIVIGGPPAAIEAARKQVEKIWHEKEKRCQVIKVEVKKQNHKHVVGPKGSHIHEILRDTGVAIEIPPLDNPSETITLRGEQTHLGIALTKLYEKAHSEVEEEMDVPDWIQSLILGPKGSNFHDISTRLDPSVNVSFARTENKIKITGSTKLVDEARFILQMEADKISRNTNMAEIPIDSKYFRFVIGKSGAVINEIRHKTGANISVPPEVEGYQAVQIVRVMGSPQEVLAAKRELEAIIERRKEADSLVSKEIKIESRFHRQIIGTKGENIRIIRDKFNQILINFPEPGSNSDIVTIKGTAMDVAKCAKHLDELNKELVVKNYRIEVPVKKELHKRVIGKDGANIKKIRDETSTRIELPNEGSLSENIIVSGKKEDVEKARKLILATDGVVDMANVHKVEIIIPNKIHNTIIGIKGRQVREIMRECGDVMIQFPESGSGSDKVTITGKKEDVLKAKTLLVNMSNDKQINSFTAEVKADPVHHRILIGKSGSNINKLRDAHNVRVFFPSENDKDDKDTIIIQGKEKEVKAAKVELEKLIKDLSEVITDEVSVEPKYHRHFFARRLVRTITDDFGGVIISFPKTDSNSDVVSLKGGKECVAGAKARILEEVSRLKNTVSIEVVIEQKYHRNIMGQRGSNVQKIQSSCNVSIRFPERPGRAEFQDKTNGEVNGDAHSEDTQSEVSDSSTPKKQRTNVILVSGLKEDCEKAKAQLLSLVPLDFEVPYEHHRFIIGAGGKDIKELMETYDVNISIPNSKEVSNTISITGSPDQCNQAMKAIMSRVNQMIEEKEARSYVQTLKVNPEHHPKIIGKSGVVITRIRKKFDVMIQFPDKKGGADASDIITIQGIEEKVKGAVEEISKIVRSIEETTSKTITIDARVHSRLIGQRGANIKTIMSKFRVDIRFPRDGQDPNSIIISGLDEDIDAASDHLLNLQDEFMDEELTEYQAPKSFSRNTDEIKITQGKIGKSGSKNEKFTVKNAPWDQKKNPSQGGEDFPSFGNGSTSQNGESASAWRPRH